MKDINLILENIVYLELLRRGYKVSIGKLDTKEIDFICEKQDKKIYIQVTYLLAAEETIQREFGFYNEITDNLNIIYVSDYFDIYHDLFKKKDKKSTKLKFNSVNSQSNKIKTTKNNFVNNNI